MPTTILKAGTSLSHGYCRFPYLLQSHQYSAPMTWEVDVTPTSDLRSAIPQCQSEAAALDSFALMFPRTVSLWGPVARRSHLSMRDSGPRACVLGVRKGARRLARGVEQNQQQTRCVDQQIYRTPKQYLYLRRAPKVAAAPARDAAHRRDLGSEPRNPSSRLYQNFMKVWHARYRPPFLPLAPRAPTCLFLP